MTCNAIVGWTPASHGYEPRYCTQQVGLRGYWARTEPWENTDHFVCYCAIEGHERSVRGRFIPREDVPQSPNTFDEPDAIDQAKWTAERAQNADSWTLA